MDSDQLAEALELAVRAAHSAASGLLAAFRDPGLEVESKQDGSPVTNADRAAELEIRRVLRESPRFGELEILGEEHGLDPRDGDHRWVIDPIDGTISFVRGIPAFGSLVALEEKASGRALVGVISLPATNEIYRAARGLGAWIGNQRVRVSQRGELAESMISLPDPLGFRGTGLEPAAGLLRQACPLTRGYTDCFGHALVLRGSLDAMLDPGLHVWDVKASEVLIEEAGGRILTRPSDREGAVDALLGSPALVERIAEMIDF